MWDLSVSTLALFPAKRLAFALMTTRVVFFSYHCSMRGLCELLMDAHCLSRYVDQGGGKRKGAFAVYLEPWHSDIFEWLDLRKNHGKEEVCQWPDYVSVICILSVMHCQQPFAMSKSLDTIWALV